MSSVSRSLYLAGELSESERLAAVQCLAHNFHVGHRDGVMVATAMCTYSDAGRSSHAPALREIHDAARDVDVLVEDKKLGTLLLSASGATIGECLSRLLVALQPVAVLRRATAIADLKNATEEVAAAERLVLMAGESDE